MGEQGGPDPRQAGPPEPARDGSGRFTRNPETAALDARAAKLRTHGMPYRAIARELGYADHSSARAAVSRALAEIVREPAEELVKLELARLDDALARAYEVLATTHYIASTKGDVVEHAGTPLVDDGPALAAASLIVRTSESRRKLLGLDAPRRVSVEAQGLNEEIRDLLGDLAGGSGGDEPGGDTQPG